jgi:hypothetical protein
MAAAEARPAAATISCPTPFPERTTAMNSANPRIRQLALMVAVVLIGWLLFLVREPVDTS